MKQKNAYGSIKFYSPEGIFMFYSNGGRFNFYMKNNLIEKYEDGYKLKFEPKGLGNADAPDRKNFCFSRENKCVISGNTNLAHLNRHHIVPTIFRKWMPEKYKSFNHKFIVMVDEKLHSRYGKFEIKFLTEVSKMFLINPPEFKINDTPLFKGQNAGKALLFYEEKILKSANGQQKVAALKENFMYNTGLEPTKENYELMLLKRDAIKKEHAEFGKTVMEKVTDYEAFELMWLKHFVDTMNPQFLPPELKELL